MRCSISRALFLPITLIAALARPTLPVASAGPDAPAPTPELAVPKAEALVLDGKPDEAAWASAATIPAEAVGKVTPTVRVLVSGGKLWLSAAMAEDVGFSIGLKFMACADGTASAADAVQASYAPQQVQGSRYVLRGPKGAGRTTYRLEGAADLVELGAWSAEASIPIEDLALPTDTTPIRLAVVVLSRQLNRFSAAPAGSAFEAPAKYAKLLPPEGGWSSSGKAVVDAEALAKEDKADDDRMAAWRDFVTAYHSGTIRADTIRERLIVPLDRVIAARPDLAMIYIAKGDILEKAGDPEAARAAYMKAIGILPHFPEAVWAVAAFDIGAYSEYPDTMPSDYAAAFARIADETKKRGGDAVSLRAAEGVLRYRLGEFAKAIELLEPVATHYPIDDELASKLSFARKYQELWAQELGMRKADEAKNLPQVKIVTSKGPVTLELFEDDAPNSVRNFVWLVKHAYYDGLAFHRVIPFFMAQGGDPFSAPLASGKGEPAKGDAPLEKDSRVGSGGPGYAIKTEPSRRRPFRGVIAMASSGRNTEGSQFFITTGTSGNLDGEYSVFGRVIEGQDVVDKLVRDDRIERVEVLRARDHEYRPTTVAGTPAPDPAGSSPK